MRGESESGRGGKQSETLGHDRLHLSIEVAAANRRRHEVDRVVAARYGGVAAAGFSRARHGCVNGFPDAQPMVGYEARARMPGSAVNVDGKVLRMSKNSPGNFFEDFRIGQVIRHATPRTVTIGDVALYTGLFGARFAVQSSDAFAKAIGYPRSPIDDLLVFHIVFGKTVPDVSLNAVANLGYAGCCFRSPVYPGDTLNALSEVIGLKENSSRKTGIVYVRTTGYNQDAEAGARICALGDGAQTRRSGAGARRSRAAAADRARSESPGRGLPADRRRRPTISRWPAARIGSAITRSARRSITSTASRSKKPST